MTKPFEYEARYWRAEYDQADKDREALHWQLTRAKSALENWGRHHPWCSQVECTCGYKQAIQDADPGLPFTQRHPKRELSKMAGAACRCFACEDERTRVAPPTKPAHVCGLSGFGRGVDGMHDRCPACDAAAAPPLKGPQ